MGRLTGRRPRSREKVSRSAAFWDELLALSGEKAGNEAPDLTQAQAKPYLDLEDLECGKEFYTRDAPRHASIDARVWGEYGPLLGR
ncbi:hypothetical protein [Nonomuraea sp. NEAU-A123]|uniref:hypothetical protein n=1 Tax=Nonomuraea sp. NEAU-A123 TaxID=2839649 RepID=UPI001BE3ED84|nr:hypothetical protein [Nonomuraea sp. NEAU-A123]MBT2232540.1 hypothetical protein [Nonomuraea sp. NEAU-A123]